VLPSGWQQPRGGRPAQPANKQTRKPTVERQTESLMQLATALAALALQARRGIVEEASRRPIREDRRRRLNTDGA